MNPARRLLVPSVLVCALLAALALAATASAEVRVGEASAPVNPLVAPDANVIAATAEYDSGTGRLTMTVTTAAAPKPPTGEEQFTMYAGVATPRVCAIAAEFPAFPTFNFVLPYEAEAPAQWVINENETSTPKFPETAGLAAMTVEGTKTTFSVTAPKAVNQPYNCAVAEVVDFNAGEADVLLFPLTAKVEPPAPPAQTPADNSGPASSSGPPPAPPAHAPGALAIAKSKPLKLEGGKWRTVRIKVSNTGGTATAAGSLRLKAPRGVLVKPERQRLPVLTPGSSWTVSARVQLTATAKAKSTIALTASAASLIARGSLALKLKG
jgi:hypothetical protein